MENHNVNEEVQALLDKIDDALRKVMKHFLGKRLTPERIKSAECRIVERLNEVLSEYQDESDLKVEVAGNQTTGHIEIAPANLRTAAFLMGYRIPNFVELPEYGEWETPDGNIVSYTEEEGAELLTKMESLVFTGTIDTSLLN